MFLNGRYIRRVVDDRRFKAFDRATLAIDQATVLIFVRRATRGRMRAGFRVQALCDLCPADRALVVLEIEADRVGVLLAAQQGIDQQRILGAVISHELNELEVTATAEAFDRAQEHVEDNTLRVLDNLVRVFAVARLTTERLECLHTEVWIEAQELLNCHRVAIGIRDITEHDGHRHQDVVTDVWAKLVDLSRGREPQVAFGARFTAHAKAGRLLFWIFVEFDGGSAHAKRLCDEVIRYDTWVHEFLSMRRLVDAAAKD